MGSLNTQSGLGSVSLVEVGPFFGVGFFQVSAGSLLYCQRSIAVLGVIADSEYVDCMGNDRHSTLGGTPADLDHDRWIRSTEVKSCC